MMRAATVSLALLALAACQKQSAPTPPPPAEPEPTEQQPPPGQDDDVTIETVPVAGNVHMLIGRGGNIGVLAGPDGKVMIDDQFAPLAPKIKSAIDAIEGGPLAFVINTHFHGDHTGGNPVFGRDATIIAHAGVRQRLSTQQNIRGRVVEPLPAVGLPEITFRDSITLHLAGEQVDVIHFANGHTDGDSVIFFRGSNAVHMGDHYFNGKFPFIDLDHGGDVESYAANVGKVIEMLPADAKVIPGHGPLSGVEELRAFHQMLTETIAHVRTEMKAGKSLAQIQKRGLPGKFAPYDGGFIDGNTWIATIHRSLSE